MLNNTKRKKWNQKEDILLLDEISKNISKEDIANNHNRTIDGITSRIIELANKMFKDNIPTDDIIKKLKITTEPCSFLKKKTKTKSKNNIPIDNENIITELNKINKNIEKIFILLEKLNITNIIETKNIVETKNITDYYVYTDGACSSNGKINAKAGIGIFFGIDDPRNLSQKIDGKQTNNIAELTAIIKTYKIIENDIKNNKRIGIVTDSEYSIKCATTYGEKCNNQNWNVDIPNKELVKTIYELYKDKPNIEFIHVRAHTKNTDIHSIGNFHADKLANLAISL